MDKQISFDLRKISPIKRFSNFVIDIIAINLLTILFFILLSSFYEIKDPNTFQYAVWFVFTISFALYYLLMEYLIGQTIGKLVTNTKVLKVNGQKPNIGDIALRTLLRLVPLEGLTFLFAGTGFHDNYSKTKLITKE